MNAPSPRPRLHFTPTVGWMNDPNGLFWQDGVWHLYYQHNPDDLVWGNIHWGHATSPDLVTWTVHEAALAPSELGVAASGCMVVDHDDRSGLGKPGHAAVVALFTHLSTDGPQVQSLAISGDGGHTFEEWPSNPFLVDPDESDFRDPKVVWAASLDCFVMVLAVGERIRLYTSDNLTQWSLLQTFGEGVGAHGGVWECPDLFELPHPAGGSRWVLVVSVQDGAPNRGSGMQVFVGDLTAQGFVPDGDPNPVWLDYGPDCYAGVTFFDAPASRRVLMAWMSNWRYANEPPTLPFRGAMTLPRELGLSSTAHGVVVTQRPAPEVEAVRGPAATILERPVGATPAPLVTASGVDELELELTLPSNVRHVVLTGSTDGGEEVRIEIDGASGLLLVDRSGVVPPGPLADSAGLPVELRGELLDLRIVVDRSSLEIFACSGTRVATLQIHPRGPLVHWRIAARQPGASVRGRCWPLGRSADGKD